MKTDSQIQRTNGQMPEGRWLEEVFERYTGLSDINFKLYNK